MPPKTVTCSICNETVLKAQTYATKDGQRACRSHEGVQAQADELAAKERARLEQATLPKPQKWQLSEEERAASAKEWEEKAAVFRDKFYHHCWICNAEGLEAREFFMELAIAMKRVQLREEKVNFFEMPSKARELMLGVRFLACIQNEGQVQDKAVVRHIRDKGIRELVDMKLTPFYLLCPECYDKHGFGDRVRAMFEEMHKKAAEFGFANMARLGGIMDPILTAAAEKKERQS